MTFYASQFNGSMISFKNWEENVKNLENILLADDNINPDTNVIYCAGYNSLSTPADQQRFEIWIPYNVETNETKSV